MKYDKENYVQVSPDELVKKGDMAWTTRNVWVDIDATFPGACGNIQAKTFLFVVRPRK